MKHKKILIAVVLGCMLILGLSACGPKEGTITLINESSYTLERPVFGIGMTYFISFGKSTTISGKLLPGEWIQAGIDKNGRQARVNFRLASISLKSGETWSDYIDVVEYPDVIPDTSEPAKWVNYITVNLGDAKFVTVRDKIE